MSREAHARFWESAGVQLPRATHPVIINERHLQQVLDEYVAYFNAWRPHRGLGQRAPCGSTPPALSNAAGKIIGRPVLGGCITSTSMPRECSSCAHQVWRREREETPRDAPRGAAR